MTTQEIQHPPKERYKLKYLDRMTPEEFYLAHQHLSPTLIRSIREKSIGTIDPFIEEGFTDLHLNSWYLLYKKMDVLIDRTRQIRDIRELAIGRVGELWRDDYSGAIDGAIFHTVCTYFPMGIEFDEERKCYVASPKLLIYHRGAVQDDLSLGLGAENHLPKFVPIEREGVEQLYTRAGLVEHIATLDKNSSLSARDGRFSGNHFLIDDESTLQRWEGGLNFLVT